MDFTKAHAAYAFILRGTLEVAGDHAGVLPDRMGLQPMLGEWRMIGIFQDFQIVAMANRGNSEIDQLHPESKVVSSKGLSFGLTWTQAASQACGFLMGIS